MRSQTKNLRKYEIFKEVLNAGSLSLAALRLQLTQPAVTSAITKLEEELGFSLFKRSHTGISLTAEAEFMLPAVERLLASANHLEDVAAELKCGRAGKIHIACMPGFPSSVAPKVIARVLKDNPMLNVAFKVAPSIQVQDGVRTGLYDLGIAESPSNTNELVADRLDFELVGIYPKGHKFENIDILSLQDFHDEPFITLDQHHHITHTLESLCAQQSVSLNAVAEAHLFPSIAAMVSEGLGVSLVDVVTARKFVTDTSGQIGFAPIDFSIPLSISLLTAKSKHVSRSIHLLKGPLWDELTRLQQE
ncbi:LysR family transcriptional regulator [Photobacterium atrarenae]|uniref:LysR family transcriptional regulator n=1 Tax=Photobacterium atrarenae TaxID=865757 RepID=A0ABY5GPQ4_9GAMM|nr:LysR family transcriptional regulator [Photobacterium atrarenae]UTV30731.1 LysR family transcriptional regulator [Photobacterium atrarenae]